MDTAYKNLNIPVIEYDGKGKITDYNKSCEIEYPQAPITNVLQVTKTCLKYFSLKKPPSKSNPSSGLSPDHGHPIQESLTHLNIITLNTRLARYSV
jgi:hypothetical protein